MEIGEILKQHQAWLEKLASRTVEKEDLRLPLDVKRRQSEQLKLRVEQLDAQKEAAVRQYDALIARTREQLRRMEAELAADEKRLEAIAKTVGRAEPAAPDERTG